MTRRFSLLELGLNQVERRHTQRASEATLYIKGNDSQLAAGARLAQQLQRLAAVPPAVGVVSAPQVGPDCICGSVLALVPIPLTTTVSAALTLTGTIAAATAVLPAGPAVVVGTSLAIDASVYGALLVQNYFKAIATAKDHAEDLRSVLRTLRSQYQVLKNNQPTLSALIFFKKYLRVVGHSMGALHYIHATLNNSEHDPSLLADSVHLCAPAVSIDDLQGDVNSLYRLAKKKVVVYHFKDDYILSLLYRRFSGRVALGEQGIKGWLLGKDPGVKKNAGANLDLRQPVSGGPVVEEVDVSTFGRGLAERTTPHNYDSRFFRFADTED
ncbi:hypothetical protein HK096_009804 [Nowakowskiella sp. JEL0078]|nr:hypothetical protein HK096_009804 [Nowakowskiella sp. JEL0078]